MNSSPDLSTHSGFIAQSLETLQQEHPQAYRLMCQQMAGREVLVRIDGEAVPLSFTIQQARLLPEAHQPAVNLSTSRETLLRIIDGDLSLERAILEEAIDLRGHIPDLNAFYNGLQLYVQGGVRCPSFPFLLERYRRLPISSQE